MPEIFKQPEGIEVVTKPCIKCMALIASDSRFCSDCGISQSREIDSDSASKWLLLKKAAIFYAIYIIICCASNFIKVFDTLSWNVFFEIAMAATSIIFFALNWEENKKLLIWNNFSALKLLAYIGIAIVGSLIVNVAVTWLNDTIFSKEYTYYSWFKVNVYRELLLVFIMAVVPAVFEELAFRGYLLQTLLKVADTNQAVYISAFLFAIIHLSFLSLFWLIPFALFIGFMRVKENTLWYGILFHFFFNLTACIIDLL